MARKRRFERLGSGWAVDIRVLVEQGDGIGANVLGDAVGRLDSGERVVGWKAMRGSRLLLLFSLLLLVLVLLLLQRWTDGNRWRRGKSDFGLLLFVA